MGARAGVARAAAARGVLWLLAAAGLVGCGGAPPAPAREVQFRSQARKVVLPNGVRIVVLGDRTTNLVELGVHVAVGSAADPPGKGGLAHLVEHVLFEIAPDGRPIGADLDSVAIDHNAFTTWDSTHYRSAARADQLERLIEIEHRRFAAGCGGLDEVMLAREREVVQNELRLRRGSPAVSVASQVQEVMYAPGHPYARPIGGDAAQVARLDVADVCGFLAEHYVPGRVTIAISGNVDVAGAIRLVTRHFGGLAARPGTPLPPIARPAPLARAVRQTIPGRTRHLVVAWPLPRAGMREEVELLAAVNALAAALGRGQVVVLGGRSAPIAALWLGGAEAARPEATIGRIRTLLERGAFPARALAARALNRMAIEVL